MNESTKNRILRILFGVAILTGFLALACILAAIWLPSWQAGVTGVIFAALACVAIMSAFFVEDVHGN